ncbi:MAG: DUF805 domain-containing protein [bacterium]|nr:DUF805 domain-containing protein [bacterium]
MSFTKAISTCMIKYVDFGGRASRSEFWWFVLLIYMTLVLSLLSALETVAGLIWIATFVPHLAVTVRRLHDTNRSGWLLLTSLIPLVGTIIVITWLVAEGDGRFSNRYGESPMVGVKQRQ